MKKYDLEGYITVSESCQIWYGVRGKGIPVVFLHGGPGSGSQNYYEINKKLFLSETQNFQLVEFDQRGCGKSEPR